jgi:hypothetical protein
VTVSPIAQTMHAVAFLDVDGGELPADLFANFSLGIELYRAGTIDEQARRAPILAGLQTAQCGRLSSPQAPFSKPEPMIKSADKPKSIHREPHQREDAGKSDFASSQRRAGSYSEHSVFKTFGALICHSQSVIG